MVRVKLIKLNVVDSAKLHTHTHTHATPQPTDRRHDDKQQTPLLPFFPLHLLQSFDKNLVESSIYRISLDVQLTLIGDFHFLITSFCN
jgi:hypothetical protein